MVLMPNDDKPNNNFERQKRKDDKESNLFGTVSAAYDNRAYNKENGDFGDGITKPQIIIEEEQIPKGKFKMSRKEKWRILKNIAIISFAFMVQFTAFQGTANLQSSINAKEGLGTVSLSAVYAALVVSCILLPTFVIKRLTVKWTLCISLLCYAPYIASQLYPRFYTLVPAGILVGLGAAPMWAAKATYLTQVASVYAKLTDQQVDGIVVRFFGFFFLAWQTAELWGNLVSSLVLSSGVHGGSGHGNHTISEEALKMCGSNFCVLGGAQSGNLERPPDSEIYEISIIYLACIAAAVAIIAFMLDPLTRYGEKQKGPDTVQLSGIELLSATANQLKRPYQQLLIPITIWVGMEQAFIGAEFTQAYISCAMGIHSVGYVMICFGVVNALCSLLFGTLMKYIGRSPLMALGFAVHACLIWVLVVWRPHPNSPHIFFTISGLWGVGDAVWQTQLNGLYGTLFRRNKEAAFSNFRLWESTGFVIAYAYSTHLCEKMKLYVMGCVLCIGFIGYVFVEIRHKIRADRRKSIVDDPKALESKRNSIYHVTSIEETDDEKDDIDDEIIVTHL